ncbi:hypothetical protein [Propionivibrio sp.]|uniref:hypothetical protein n=1 Tax=Propionivibrio sp. TaxID=2212460 RepID=UPI003BF17E21
MHPVHDVDALLLLAVTLSSKRRPAVIVEIIAAADLIQGTVPSELKLVEAFHRLSMHGLICEEEGGFTLSPEAQKIMTGQPRKADALERIMSVKEKLAAYDPKGEHAPVLLTAKQLCTAILAHRKAEKAPGKNLLVPKVKVDGDIQRPGQRQRKPLPARRRKD